MTSPVIAVVPDTSELYSWVLTRRDHHPRCVGIQMGVADRQAMSMVGDAVLHGLGKDPWLSVSKRPAELLAGCWLASGETTDVIVGYAQLISEWLVPELLTWFTGLGVRPWLVYSHFENESDVREAAEKVAADWGVEVVGETELHAAWGGGVATTTAATNNNTNTTADHDDHGGHHTTNTNTNTNTTPPTASSLPSLPRVDGVAFRSKCRDLLTAEQFAYVDEQFVAEARLLRDGLDRLGPKHKRHQYAELLRTRLGGARDVEEFVLRTRAAQVAGITSGIHVTVDTNVMIGAATALPREGRAEPEQWWGSLARYRDPDPGAVAALYNAGIDPEHMPSIEVGSVHVGEPVTVEVDGDTFEVAGGGASFVAALWRLRMLSSAAPADPLLSTHRAGHVRPQFVSKMLWSVSNDTGVAVAPTPTHRRQPEAVTWLARHGVKIEVSREDAARAAAKRAAR